MKQASMCATVLLWLPHCIGVSIGLAIMIRENDANKKRMLPHEMICAVLPGITGTGENEGKEISYFEFYYIMNAHDKNIGRRNVCLRPFVRDPHLHGTATLYD